MKRIHMIGVCGTAMGALAGQLVALGHEVRGSDAMFYPPMSDKLEEWGVTTLKGFNAAHLDPSPDLVIVGNVVRRDNPEAVEMRERELPYLSMAEAIAEFMIRDKHSIVISGTHGKTTTTALGAHVLMSMDKDPSYLVGGALVGYSDSFRTASGPDFIIEGDEYDTAYFDKGPKFRHYRAQTALITSLEFDHADIFDSVEDVEAAFGLLIESTSSDGHIVVSKSAPRAFELLRALEFLGRVTTYSADDSSADYFASEIKVGPTGTSFKLHVRDEPIEEVTVALWGTHSVENALGLFAALEARGLERKDIAAAMATFPGVKKRLEIIGTASDITVVEDFGHHPTAVELTIDASRGRFGDRPLWAVFEPRSATSRRNIFEEAYYAALKRADAVALSSHPRLAEIPSEERFDPERLVARLSEDGLRAVFGMNVEDLHDGLVECARPGDVIILFSNGDFGGLSHKLLESFQTREARRGE